MAQLSQAFMSVADTDKITISMWARLNSLSGATLYGSPASTYYVPLLEFGDPSDASSRATSGLWLQITSDLSSVILVAAAAGRPNSIDYKNCMSGNWQHNSASFWTDAFDYVSPTGHVNAGPNNIYTTQGTSWFPRSSIAVADSGVLQIGKWVHIFVTFDTSIQSENTVGSPPSNAISGPLVNCVLSGVNEGPFTPFDTRANLVSNLTVLESFFGPMSDPWIILNTTADPTAYPSATDTGAAGGAGTPDPHPGGVIRFIVPAFDIATSGMQMVLPGGFFSNSKLQLYDVQVWMGQAISPTSTNLAKFITLLPGGHGRAVKNSVSIARSAFGQQTFAFSGKKSRFITNQGTGGSFVKTGTINDIAAPSF